MRQPGLQFFDDQYLVYVLAGQAVGAEMAPLKLAELAWSRTRPAGTISLAPLKPSSR